MSYEYSKDGLIEAGCRKKVKQITTYLSELLNLGGEVNAGIWKVLFGAKAYSSLNEVSKINKGRYFGFGLVAGVKF
ncbi:MAG: hypothetical protein ABJC12_03095 [Saprospiraceae bacterium]